MPRGAVVARTCERLSSPKSSPSTRSSLVALVVPACCDAGRSVGEEALGCIVGDPDRHAVGPDPARGIVCEIAAVYSATRSPLPRARRRRAPHPTRRPRPTRSRRRTRDRARRCSARRGRCRGARRAPRSRGRRRRAGPGRALEIQGRLAVGPDAARGAVTLVEIEFQPDRCVRRLRGRRHRRWRRSPGRPR